MIPNQYYYLVTGLPELVFDAENRKIDLQGIKNELKVNVVEEHQKFLNALFMHYDNENVIAYINGKKIFNDLGTVPAAAYEELSDNLPLFPKYIQEFFADRAKEKSEDDVKEEEVEEVPTSPEVDLLTRYYKFVDQLDNKFLNRWFKFDRQLRNILAAFSARKLDKDVAQFLIGKDEITEHLAKNLSPDFGLRGESALMDKVMHALDSGNLLDREKRIDQLRWNLIEETNTFVYFNIDKLLGFWIKAEIVARWIKLDPATGEALLKQYFTELKGEFDLNAAFDIENEK